VVESYGGFVIGAEVQQAIVVGMLLLILVWRQILLRRHRQALK